MIDISISARLRAFDCISMDGCGGNLREDAADHIDAQAARIAELTGERDRQYEQNAEFIVKIAELEATLETAREDALREAEQVCDNERMEAVKYKLPHIALGALWCRRKITALIDKEPTQ